MPTSTNPATRPRSVTLHVDRAPAASWEEALERLDDGEFRNLTRSTIPLLAYWADPLPRLAALGRALGVDPGDPVRLHLEFQVPSLGRAKPSHTDLMVVSPGLAVAIEGKSTEPTYPTVTEWLAQGGPNRETVLGHWLGLIRSVSRADPGEVGHLTYQMVHRLASLCSVEAPRRALVYQVFEVGAATPDYEGELTDLTGTLGTADRISLWVHRVQARPTPALRRLQETLTDLDAARRPPLVRRALLADRLFSFGNERWTRASP